MSRPPKARKISAFLAFPRFSADICFGKKLLTTDLTTYGFDRKNRISGCRVTVTRLLWEQVQAGSTPVIPTKDQPKMRFFAPLPADFLLIIGFYPPLQKISMTAENGLCHSYSTSRFIFFRKIFSWPTALQFLRADQPISPRFLLNLVLFMVGSLFVLQRCVSTTKSRF